MQLAETAAGELLADEALDKARANCKQANKERQKAQKQVQQHQHQQPISASDTHLEQLAAAEQQVQHEAQHMQAAQLQATQSLHAAESAAVAQQASIGHLHDAHTASRSLQVQHAEQKHNSHLNSLDGVTRQLSNQLAIHRSDQAGPSAHQDAVPTELNMPSNPIYAKTGTLLLCPLTKVTVPLDS